jgi:hypothetical protein
MFYPYLSLWFSEFEGVFLTLSGWLTVPTTAPYPLNTEEEMVGAKKGED